MDTGLDGPQFQAMKKAVGKAVRDPPQLRLIVAGLVGVVGIFALCRPESQALEAARAKCEEVEAVAADAEELKHLVQQADSYGPRLPKLDSASDWQDYVSQQLEAAGVTLRKIEPRKTLESSLFRVIVMEVTVDGTYQQLVDFLDRIERGERVCRVDRLTFEKRAAMLGLRFQFFGLVKLRA